MYIIIICMSTYILCNLCIYTHVHVDSYMYKTFDVCLRTLSYSTVRTHIFLFHISKCFQNQFGGIILTKYLMQTL